MNADLCGARQESPVSGTLCTPDKALSSLHEREEKKKKRLESAKLINDTVTCVILIQLSLFYFIL